VEGLISLFEGFQGKVNNLSYFRRRLENFPELDKEEK